MKITRGVEGSVGEEPFEGMGVADEDEDWGVRGVTRRRVRGGGWVTRRRVRG